MSLFDNFKIKNRDGFSTTMVFLVLAVSLVAFGGLFYALKNSEELTLPKEPEWLVYQNKDWGFEIKYPPEKEPNVVIDAPEDNSFSLLLGSGDVFRMGIYGEDMAEHSKLYLIEGSEREVLVGGLEGLKFKTEDQKGASPHIPKVKIINEGRLYLFVGEGEDFNEILSTFRFLNF